MNRYRFLMFIAWVLPLFFASTASGGDYLVRLDTIRDNHEHASAKHDREEADDSIAAAARPGSAFFAEVRTGKETRTLQGELTRAEDGRFTVKVNYVRATDTGITIQAEDGAKTPLLDVTSIQTSIAVPLNEPMSIGGVVSELKSPGKPSRKSKTRYVVILKKLQTE